MEKVGIVIFYNQEVRKIGDLGDIKAGEEVDINDFPVIMKFYRKESIDVVIEALLEAKRDMELITHNKYNATRYGHDTNVGTK